MASSSGHKGTDSRRALLIVLGIAAVIAVPAGIAGGMQWLDLPALWSKEGRPTPQWTSIGQVRATTQDGTLVKVRVALDAGNSDTRRAVERRLREVQLLLEVSVNTQRTQDLAGAHGIEQMSAEMRRRIDEYLATEGAGPLKSLLIQDLWYTRAP